MTMKAIRIEKATLISTTSGMPLAPVAASTNPFSSDNERRARFGLGSASLGDGYASFVPGQRSPDQPYYSWWFDEFGVAFVQQGG